MLIALDVVLLIGLTLRLTRLVTTDSLGEWFIRYPAMEWAGTSQKRHDLVKGLECPYCVGFWIGVAALGSLYWAGGPGAANEIWRYASATFALNYLVGHVSAKVD